MDGSIRVQSIAIMCDLHEPMAETPKLELLHQPLPNRPHPRSFAVDVHRNGEQQKTQLDASQG